LLLDDRGCVAEGGNSNAFFVRDGGLVTPSLACGILAGITREVVMELAAKLDIKISEQDIRLTDLAGFEEAFLTSSIIEVMPLVAVRKLNGRAVTFGNGKPGDVTKHLMAAYREMVEKETS
jgi:branched-subunit amino acid aminotransferase/4-amino-4-deoxychorismate lyase